MERLNQGWHLVGQLGPALPEHAVDNDAAAIGAVRLRIQQALQQRVEKAQQLVLLHALGKDLG